jgi:Mg/Co/Ni transporter MgtE
MEPEEAEEIQELMEHEDDTAGGLMNNSFMVVNLGQTAGEAFATVRASAPEVEMLSYAYVLDEAEKLLGIVSLRELLISPPETPLAEIMEDNIKFVTPDAEPEDVLEIIAKYNLVSVPVLDENEIMLGIITVDDILEMFLPYALKRKRHG